MGFFDQDNSTFDPITGANYYDPRPTPDTSQDTGNPFDNSGSNAPPADRNKPSTFSQILSSIGLTPDALGVLATGQPPQPALPPPRVGGIGSDYASSGGLQPGVPMPPANPMAGPAQQANVAAAPGAIPVPLPQSRPANMYGPGGPPAPQQTGAQPAPTPPGAPMNILPPAAQPKLNPLQQLITGGRPSGTLGLQQMISGAGKGLANIQGNGRFASFARGLGGGIEGANEQQKVQFQQATQDFNNSIKLLATGSAVQKNAALANLYQKRQDWLTQGKGGNAWQASPYGRQVMANKEADTHYKTEMISLDKRSNQLSPQAYNQEKQRIQKETADLRNQRYKEYGVDPAKGADGFTMQNPIDTTKFKNKLGTPEGDKEFNDNVPPGAFFKTPDGQVRMRPPQQTASAQEQSAATPQRDEVDTDTGTA